MYHTGPQMTNKYSQPFAICERGKPNLIGGLFGDVKGGNATAEANAALIVQAVNEFEALCAVAEAARKCEAAIQQQDGNLSLEDKKLRLEWALNSTRQALAALEAVRKGAQ